MSTEGPSKIIVDGLICHMDASNSRSYPGSGTTWYDLTGNGNNGTISSGEFVSGEFGGYLRNSGNVSNFLYVTVAHSTSINSAFTVTIGGWTIEEIIWTNSVTYPEADAGSVASDAAYGVGATGFDWNHGTVNTYFRFGQSSNSGGSYEDDASILNIPSQYTSLNAWRVRTMVWNRGANTNYLYINGELIGTVSTPNTAGTAVYDGGGIIFGTLYGWKHFGRRASIKIYNRALSLDEVYKNYSSLKSRFRL
jgi:hypothetical protein